MNPVALGIFLSVIGAIIVRQLLGRGPRIWMIFGVGAVAALATEALSLIGAAQTLVEQAPVLLFLLALFLFAGALQESGALDHIARWLIGRPQGPEGVPMAVFLGFGIASAFVVNDALVLLAVPLLVAVGRHLDLDPKPLLLTVAFAVTVGSALTPLGNPQNLLLSLSSGIPTPLTTFLRYLALPIGASLLFGGWYVSRIFARSMQMAKPNFPELRKAAPTLLPRGAWASRLRRRPVILIFPATIAAMIGLEIASALWGTPAVALWIPALVGAAAMLAVSPGRVALGRAVNVPILLLFVGLFLVVATAQAGGLIGGIEATAPVAGPSTLSKGIASIVGTSALAPQLVSNVPWVALEIPVLHGLGYGSSQPTAWLALGAASTLAGNVTLLGAASNLIVVEQAEQLGIRIRLGEFVRYALPIAALSLALTLVCLLYGL